MGETKKAKPWAVIALALAGGALAVDRFVIPASADDASQINTAASGQPGDREDAAGDARFGPSLADQFERFDVTESDAAAGLAEAFEVPKALRGDTSAAPRAERAPEEIGLRLSSILTRDGERLAIVNGRPLRVGDSVSGAMLLHITDSSVTVDTAIGPVVLELARPSLD